MKHRRDPQELKAIVQNYRAQNPTAIKSDICTALGITWKTLRNCAPDLFENATPRGRRPGAKKTLAPKQEAAPTYERVEVVAAPKTTGSTRLTVIMGAPADVLEIMRGMK